MRDTGMLSRWVIACSLVANGCNDVVEASDTGESGDSSTSRTTTDTSGSTTTAMTADSSGGGSTSSATSEASSSEGSSGRDDTTRGSSSSSSTGDGSSSSTGDGSSSSTGDGSSSSTGDGGSSSTGDGGSSSTGDGGSSGASSSGDARGTSSGDGGSTGGSGSTGGASSDTATTTDGGGSGGATDASSSGGIEPSCGNGVVEPGEICDDQGESAACDLDCTAASCGDAVVNASASELCDDGNGADADGCDADCTTTDVAAIAAGGQHTCALFDAGALRCWGAGASGALGLGDTADIGDDEAPASTDVIDLGGFAAAIGAGYFHTCALQDDGFVRCWGDSTYGQLGLGDTAHIGDDEPPAAVGPIDLGGPATQLMVGAFHNCAILASGDVVCWGAGDHGQLGLGNTEHIGDDELPSTVSTVDIGGTVLQLTAGVQHTCARLDDRSVRCWGEASEGQLGYGNTDDLGDDELPGSIGVVDLGGDVVEQVVAGGFHTCARVQDGGVRCWGANNFGQLGYGNTENLGDDELPSTAGLVDVGGVAIDLAGGFFHSCALLEDGSVRCWGFADFGELGRGDTVAIGDDEVPGSVAPIDLGGPADALNSRNDHTCVRRLDTHGVRCWGLGGAGRLGYVGVDDVGDDEAPAVMGDVTVF
ncbi:MAG: hypothetical protein IPN32_25640 [Deltaproteobacteria bacterium]|nr:hypothetical protein [Deltaproteobacteria bacterium]